MSWPPENGSPLPNADRAHGVHEKLAGYSLKLDHVGRGKKAEGFARILAITVTDLEYLAEALLAVSARRRCPGFGLRASTASIARSSCRCADFGIAPIELRAS